MQYTVSDKHSSPSSHPVSYRAVLVCFALIPILFVPGIETPDLLPRLLLLQVATLIAAIAWFFAGSPLRPSPFYLPVAIYFLILAASSLWAITPFRSVSFLAKHATLFVFFFLLANTLQKRHLSGILTVAALTGGLTSLFGILEYHQIIPQWIPSTGRPSSTFMFRNLAAHYLITNLPLAGLLFLTARNHRGRWIGSVSATFMFVFLLYTRTRGAWLGLFCATVLNLGLWALVGRSTLLQTLKSVFNRQAIVFAIGALCFIALLGPLKAGFSEQHTQRFDEKKADISSAITSIFREGGDRGRMKMWEFTLQMISDAPFFGQGLGNWEYVYPRYDRGDQISPGTTPRRPHNDLLWMASEIGLIGLLSYLIILVLILRQALHLWQRSTSHQACLVGLMCSISIFAMIGDGFFNFPWERLPPSINFWFCVATISIWSNKQKRTIPASKHTRWAIALASLLLLGALSITAKNTIFDYYFIKALRASLLEDALKASREAKRGLAFGPFNHQLFVIYAQSLRKQEKYIETEQSLLQSLNYHPYFANTYNNLGHLYDEWGKPKQALGAYYKALDLMPHHHKARYNMGIVYEKIGQVDSAIVAYREAFARDIFASAAHNLAGLYKKRGEIDSAKTYYFHSLSAPNPRVESLFNLGNLFTEQHDFENAIKSYEAFSNQWKGDTTYLSETKKYLSEAYSGRGVQIELQGDLDQARSLYQTAIAHWPENAMNWYNLGNILRQTNDTNNAIKAYHKSIELNTLHTNAYNNLGLTHTALKQYPKAIEVFNSALQIHPDRADILLNLANAYLGKGDVYQARETYTRALQMWEGDQATKDAIRNILQEIKTTIGK